MQKPFIQPCFRHLYFLLWELLFLMIVLHPCVVSGQGEGPAPPGPHAVFALPGNVAVPNGAIFTLRMYVYVFRKSDGTGGISLQDAEEALALLDSYFNPHDIYFQRGCIIEIKDDAYYFMSSDHCDLFYGPEHPYRKDDGLNLYLGLNAGGSRNSGVPGNCALVVGYRDGILQAKSPIVAQQIGHCLGLFPTHYTGFGDECDFPAIAGCRELVNGTNGALCGDFIPYFAGSNLGTPADPNMNWNVDPNTCQWLGSAVDPNGDPYDPDERNIMAYSNIHCMDKFDVFQVERMRVMIFSQPILQQCAVLPPIDVTISSSTTWDAQNAPNGGSLETLTIEGGATLTVAEDVVLRFTETGKVVIKPNAELVLHGMLTASACGDYWQGVIVVGNTAQSQIPVNGVSAQGALNCMPGSVIEAAVVGVRLYDPQFALVTTGGKITCEGAVFRNNRVGIDILNYKNFWPFNFSLPLNTPLGYNAKFTQCQFVNDASFPEGLGGFDAFVNMKGVDGVRFYGCAFRNEKPTTGNMIDDWGYGIRAFGAGFSVEPYCTGAVKPCQEYAYSTFEGLGYGIQSLFVLENKPFDVMYARFDNCFIGIYNQAVRNTRILFNEFKLNKLPSTSVTQDQIGLYMRSINGGFTISENWFGRAYDDDLGINTVGIACYNVGTVAEEIRRNTFHELYIGNLANGVNTGVKYICNTNEQILDLITPEVYDIAVTEGSSVNSNQQVTINPFTYAAGNEFSYAMGAESDFLNQGDSVNYFFYQTGNQEPLDYTTTSILLFENNVQPNLCEQEVCYPACVEIPIEVPRQAFYYHKGEIETLSQQTPTPEIQQQLEYHQWEMGEAAQELLDHMLRDTVANRQDSLKKWLDLIDDYGSDLWLASLYYMEGQTTAGAALLDSLPGKHLLDAGEAGDVSRYKYVLTQVAARPSVYELDSTTLNALLPYADSSGSSGALARGVLMMYGYRFAPRYEFPTLARGESREDRLFTGQSLTLFPNPASEVIQVSKSDGLAAELVLFDLYGKAVKRALWPEGQPTLRLDTGQLPGGLYVVRVVDKEGRQASSKVLIRKR